MQEDKKSFEDNFNMWYKKFLDEEKEMNKKTKEAKDNRDLIINKSRKEARERIKTFEMEQKDKLEAEKEKLNVTKNNFDQLNSEFQSQINLIQNDYKHNKDKVIDYLIDGVMAVNIEIPDNIKQKFV